MQRGDAAHLHINQGAVPLSAVILRRNIGNGYRAAIGALVSAGIIEGVKYARGAVYSVKRQECKLYRYTSRYIDRVCVTQPFGEVMAARIRSWIISENKHTEVTRPELMVLRDGMRSVKFDVMAARDQVARMRDTYTAQQYNVRMSAIARMDAIQRGDVFPFHFQENCGRLFTSLTNLPKDLLMYVRGGDGERMVELDVANSQPYFLSVMAARDGIVCRSMDACSAGVFYDAFTDRITGYTRDEIKQEVLAIVYDSEWRVRREDRSELTDKCARVWRECYGNLYEYVQKYKRGRRGRELAKMMQRKEGELVLTAARIFAEHRPGVSIFTRHDSISVPEVYGEYIERLLTSLSADIFTSSVKVRRKVW